MGLLRITACYAVGAWWLDGGFVGGAWLAFLGEVLWALMYNPHDKEIRP